MKHVKSPGASGVLVISGKALVLRRATDDTEPGNWEFPKGKVDSNEKVEEAVLREYKEETDLDVKIKKIIGPNNWSYKRGNTEIRVEETVFEVELGEDEDIRNLKLSIDHDKYQWVDKNDAMKLEPIVDARRNILLSSLGS